MKKIAFLIGGLLLSPFIQAQKVESIYFNLYTDSLKKGFFNYINVDGKTVDGQWIPLDSTQVRFSANTGYFKGNDLYIDSTYKGDTITVRAVLKSNPAIWKEVTIHIRKRGFDEPLKTNEEILQEIKEKGKKPKQRTGLISLLSHLPLQLPFFWNLQQT